MSTTTQCSHSHTYTHTLPAAHGAGGERMLSWVDSLCSLSFKFSFWYEDNMLISLYEWRGHILYLVSYRWFNVGLQYLAITIQMISCSNYILGDLNIRRSIGFFSFWILFMSTLNNRNNMMKFENSNRTNTNRKSFFRHDHHVHKHWHHTLVLRNDDLHSSPFWQTCFSYCQRAFVLYRTLNPTLTYTDRVQIVTPTPTVHHCIYCGCVCLDRGHCVFIVQWLTAIQHKVWIWFKASREGGTNKK